MTKPSEGYSYDPACEGIAYYFLGARAESAEIKALSQRVQDAIEEWLLDREIRSKDAVS